ncbi:hypothetical protein BURMUCF1_A0479 [Burkholderia multivorans ATCC BAA-247]|nr:hypothetical protein BURMUCF1_A0479 [Burkholderia multivorans ATCC BAA-247]
MTWFPRHIAQPKQRHSKQQYRSDTCNPNSTKRIFVYSRSLMARRPLNDCKPCASKPA